MVFLGEGRSRTNSALKTAWGGTLVKLYLPNTNLAAGVSRLDLWPKGHSSPLRQFFITKYLQMCIPLHLKPRWQDRLLYSRQTSGTDAAIRMRSCSWECSSSFSCLVMFLLCGLLKLWLWLCLHFLPNGQTPLAR